MNNHSTINEILYGAAFNTLLFLSILNFYTLKHIPIIISIMTMFIIGCGPDKSSEDGHGHDHAAGGLEPVSYTLYSDKTEIFVEFKPLVVGEISKFAAHFTILGERFTPLNEGTVTVSLITGDKGIQMSANEPSSPGIYRLALKPTVAGKGKLIFKIESKDFSDQITIEDVPIYADESSAISAQQPPTGGDDVSYLKEQAWKVNFANTPVLKQLFSSIIKTSGQIMPSPGDEYVVSAQISGIITFANQRILQGSDIAAGSQLFTLKSNEVVQSSLGTAVLEAENELAAAQKNYDRAKELVKDRIISDKEFLAAKLRFENAQNQLSRVSVSKKFNTNRQNITASVSGYLKDVFVENGQYVEAGQALATISKNKKLILQANVSLKYFDKIPLITSANFKPANSLKIYSTYTGDKKITYGRSISENTPFVPIHFEIESKGDIIPGTVGEVFLKLSTKQSVLVIPASSLIEEQGLFFVFVQTEGEKFQKREVTIGGNDGQNVSILDGVKEGERVVNLGAYYIKLAMASGVLPAHGHEH
jgi:RND family efflux transporter MFP subunit